MNQLTPEVRVNKNGVPVTKHVRGQRPQEKKGLLSRILPALDPSARVSVREHKAALKSALGERYVASTAKEMEALGEYYSPRDMERDETLVSQFLRNQPLEIIELLHSTYPDREFQGLVDRTRNEPPHIVGSYVLYPDCGLPYYDGKQIIADVSSSLQIDDINEFQPGTPEHESVSAVITLAAMARKSRTDEFYKDARARSSRADWDYIMDMDREREDGIQQMTPALSRVALEYPYRLRDIADYLIDHDATPESFDEGHLRLTLNNAASSLNSGVL